MNTRFRFPTRPAAPAVDILRWRLIARREAYLARQHRTRQRRTLVAIITTAALLAALLFYGVTP